MARARFARLLGAPPVRAGHPLRVVGPSLYVMVYVCSIGSIVIAIIIITITIIIIIIIIIICLKCVVCLRVVGTGLEAPGLTKGEVLQRGSTGVCAPPRQVILKGELRGSQGRGLEHRSP